MERMPVRKKREWLRGVPGLIEIEGRCQFPPAPTDTTEIYFARRSV